MVVHELQSLLYLTQRLERGQTSDAHLEELPNALDYFPNRLKRWIVESL